MTQLNALFQPIQVGNMRLRNRLVFPGVHTNYNGARLRDFYEELAKGGVGLIMAGGFFIGNPGLKVDQLALYSDDDIPGLRELAKVAHENGAKMAAQITSRFWMVKPSGERDMVGPSDLVINPRGGVRTRALTVDEIDMIVTTYGQAARRIKKAGMDGVELHSGIGGLINQFISSYSNKRQDEYGGSLEKRMRFVLRIIEETHRVAGKDFPIITRLSGEDFMEGGHTLTDTQKVAAILEQAGVCAITMNTGWHEAPIPFFHTSVPRGRWVYMAEGVKQSVKIPVVTGTRIVEPVLANRILEEGRADMVYMARPLIADPELPNKAREGRLEDIRPCISCSYCFHVAHTLLQPMACSVNPMLAKAKELAAKPAGGSKKVVVVGGGPAGMQAAQTAAARGQRVVLFEKGQRMGGQLLLAAVPPFKQEIHPFTEYLIRQLDKLGVETRLGQEATALAIEQIKPDAVIVATGASPEIPDIPGAHGENVVKATDVLSGASQAKQNIVIVGGGLIGCETAEFLAAAGKQVTILSRQPRLGGDIENTNRWVVMQRLREAGIRMEPNCTTKEITGKGVRAVREGKEEFFEADTVVLAPPMAPDKRLAEQLKGRVAELYIIGDSAQPGKIVDSTASGLRAGHAL